MCIRRIFPPDVAMPPSPRAVEARVADEADDPLGHGDDGERQQHEREPHASVPAAPLVGALERDAALLAPAVVAAAPGLDRLGLALPVADRDVLALLEVLVDLEEVLDLGQ